MTTIEFIASSILYAWAFFMFLAVCYPILDTGWGGRFACVVIAGFLCAALA